MKTTRQGWWQRIVISVTALLILTPCLTACQPSDPDHTPTPPGIPSQPTIAIMQPTEPPQPVAETFSLQNGEAEQVLGYIPNGRINDLPIPSSVSIVALPTAPANTAFENGQWLQETAEIIVPEGWIAWWRQGVVDCSAYIELGIGNLCPTYLTQETALYKRPQFSLITSTQPEYAERVFGEGQTARFFCTYGLCAGGYLQRIQVVPGETYSLSVWAQSWCANQENGHLSQLETQTDRLNCLLSVGIDPTGGVDPLSQEIVWSNLYSYDHFSLVQTPPITATTGAMTLYLRGRNLWGFQHNDFHFDEVQFTQLP